MKNLVASIIFLGAFTIQGISQTSAPLLPKTDSKEYEQMKLAGKIPAGLQITNTNNFAPSIKDLERLGVAHKMPAGGGCSCYVPPDGTYTLAMAPNDDGSTGSISIPFSFCLYGTNYTSLFINNNGNISFVTSYGTYSSTPFPFAPNVMVAPFWADVDTRGTGTVKYKITATAMYVNWEAVGYFPSAVDKVNTFQLIITDGTDPILPSGNNIAFCYGDMQWTTGSASGGVGGFGGTLSVPVAYPATAGINKGDAINYVQIGRFWEPGAAYDGGYGADDGVSWLDNQSFYFNACSSTNIPPIVSGLNNCDTIKICGSGDTLILNGLFLSPEIGQTTTVAINLNSTPGASILGTTSGNSASGQVQIIASAANAGNNIITFTATDDGVPVGTTVVNVNVFVDTTGLSAFNPVISGITEFCQGDSSILSVTPTTFDSYVWSDGTTFTTTTADHNGLYFCTATWNGCSKTTSIDIVEHPNPAPFINGPLFTCGAGSTTLYIDSIANYSSFSWSNASTNDSITVSSGTFTVTATSLFGCTGTSAAVTVVNANPTVNITGNQIFCPGDNITLLANPSIPSGANYLWTNADTTQSSNITSSGNYGVTVSYNNGCLCTDTVNVTQFNSPVANFSTSPSLTSPPFTLVNFTDLSSVSPGTIVAWYWNFGDSLTSTSSLQNPTHTYSTDGTYTVTLAVQSNNGCWDTIRIEYQVVSDIMVPNVFTPNNDGVNDLLVFKNLEFFPGTSLTVFNRWGSKVYNNSNYHNDWGGEGHSDGVYYFILEGPALKETKYGFVHIMR